MPNWTPPYCRPRIHPQASGVRYELAHLLGIVMESCIQSVWYFSASNDCLGWAVPLLIAVGGGIIFGGQWLWRHTQYVADNFRIQIVNRLPPDFHVNEPSERPIPRGASDIILCVYCRYKFKVKRIDFRILDHEYQPCLRFLRGFPANVEITELEDLYDGGLSISQSNGIGGMEGEYANGRSLARKQGLYFRIRIEAGIPNYRGYISFRAQNEEGERSFARYAFWVDPNAPESSLPMHPMPTIDNPPPGWEMPT